jgi:hypothetical protein
MRKNPLLSDGMASPYVKFDEQPSKRQGGDRLSSVLEAKYLEKHSESISTTGENEVTHLLHFPT